ncbi:hypothetical protein GCM10023191_102440 [Actinoallomurus oryzae]|uniref:FtsK domain-containing protein n=1 Tax=Actinoallomurus oryzae TaxID=502180 RepID=A0ABP8R9S7_9ACTN
MATKTKDRREDQAKPEQTDADAGQDVTGEEEATSQWRPASWPGRVWSDVRATRWRLRRQLLPHTVAAGVGGTGLAAHAIAAHGAAPGQIAMVLAGTSVPAALWIARKVKKRKPRWTKRVLLAGLIGAGWLTLAPYGMGPEQAALLIGAEYALAARWWQHHRPGYPDPAAPPPTKEKLESAEQIMADYREFAASKGAALEGSVLINPVQTRYTIAFDLGLNRGKQSIATLYSNLGKLATALDCNVEDLVPEPHPVLSSAWCRLQVLIDSPIAGNVDFTGPRREGGLLRLGPYADGDGEVPYKLYTPGSMWSGVVIGGTGIGKSRLIENAVISAISGGDTVYWFLDPQNGTSSPALAEHADWFATLDNADDVLDALLAIVDARGRQNAAMGIMEFTPSPERPGLLVVIDECHVVFADPNKAADWARIAREGRKVGVALLLASQYPGLETFGGKDAMRSSVMAGNAFALHTVSNQAKGLIPGLTVDPKELPKIPGYGYVLGTDPDIGLRTAPWRNRNTGSKAAQWLADQPMPGLDTFAATATLLSTEAYRDRHENNTTAYDAAREFVDALTRGELPDQTRRRARRTRSAQPAAADLGRIISFPGPITQAVHQRPAVTGPNAVATAGAAAAPLALGDSHRMVLAAIAAGNSQPKGICDAVGLSRRQVQDLLAELLRAGYVTRTGAGSAVRYSPAA